MVLMWVLLLQAPHATQLYQCLFLFRCCFLFKHYRQFQFIYLPSCGTAEPNTSTKYQLMYPPSFGASHGAAAWSTTYTTSFSIFPSMMVHMVLQGASRTTYSLNKLPFSNSSNTFTKKVGTRVPGLVNFAPAIAAHLCLNSLLEKISQCLFLYHFYHIDAWWSCFAFG